MGIFSKSIIIILIAVSTPLLYRRFADDSTVKFMSSYYSDYKSIDRFIRQSAGHLDEVRKNLPNSEQIKSLVGKVSKEINKLVELQIADKFSKKTSPTTSKPESSKSKKEAKRKSHKLVTCPGENLEGAEIRLWSKEELARYDGSDPAIGDVYIGFLGLVYNVTMNKQHYGLEADYNAFAGRDATRAFVTGNFTHDLNDDISDLDENLFSQLESWSTFYKASYAVVGRIEGNFFDSRGCGTKALAKVLGVFNKLQQAREARQSDDVNLPECNSEWNVDLKKGRVWCSLKSGGVERDWVGVPRIYHDGGDQRCVCLNKDDPEAHKVSDRMDLYPDCNPESFECTIKP